MAADSSPERWSRRHWYVMAGIVLVTLAAYSNSFRGQFVLDDLAEIRDNPAIRRVWPPVEAMIRGHKLPARALPYLTFAIDHALWGVDPPGYHVTNLLIHVVAALALFRLAFLTLSAPRIRPTFGGFALPVSAVIAILWAVHPLQTQAVTYVYQRIESLCGMLCLVSLAAYAQAASDQWNRRWLALSVAAAAAANLTKENAITLPLVVVALDWCCLARDGTDFRSRWRVHAALLATTVLCGLHVWLQSAKYSEFARKPHGMLAYALTQPGVIVRYLRLVFWPYGQQFMYDWPPATRLADWLPQALLLAGMLAITLVGLARRAPWVWLGCVFFLLLAPTSSVMPVRALVAEHRMYLPLAAVSAAVVLATVATLQSAAGPQARHDRPVWPWLAGIAVAIVATWLASLTYARNAIYQDRSGFWAALLETDPTNAFANDYFAQRAAEEGDAETAVARARRALASDPELDALGHLAGWYLRNGAGPRANDLMREAIADRERRSAPDSWALLDLRQTLANMLHDQKKIEAAEAISGAIVADLERVLGPGHGQSVNARTILARAALARGDREACERISRANLAAARRSLGVGDPATQEVAVTLSQVLFVTDRVAEAEALLRDLIGAAEALRWRWTPDLRLARRTLASLLETQDRHREALVERRAVLAETVSRLGENDPESIRAAVQVQACATAGALRDGDQGSAEKCARQGLGLAITGLGVADPTTQGLARDYAAALAAGGRQDDAERMLRAFLDEVAKASRSEAGTLLDATIVQTSLAELLAATGRNAEALKIRRLILRFLLKLRGPDDPATQEAARAVEQMVAELEATPAAAAAQSPTEPPPGE